MSPSIQPALKRNARTWRHELAVDPELGNLRLEIAAVGRVLATEEDDSEAYQAARRLDWQLRDELRQLEQQRCPRRG